MKVQKQPDDQRRAWREEEERLVERWKAASLRCSDAEGQIALQGGAQPSEAMLNEAAAARSELESTRKRLARIKSEFREGKRY